MATPLSRTPLTLTAPAVPEEPSCSTAVPISGPWSWGSSSSSPNSPSIGSWSSSQISPSSSARLPSPLLSPPPSKWCAGLSWSNSCDERGVTGEYPEERLFSDPRRECEWECEWEWEWKDMSRLEACRRCDETGLCDGVRGGDDMAVGWVVWRAVWRVGVLVSQRTRRVEREKGRGGAACGGGGLGERSVSVKCVALLLEQSKAPAHSVDRRHTSNTRPGPCSQPASQPVRRRQQSLQHCAVQCDV